MDKTKKYLAFSFVMVLVAVTIVSVIGMILLDRKPVVLQGQIEATEIRISGKLPGRIDRFLVEEGERVAAGDTLVVINSPEALAKYEQVQDRETELVSCPYFTTSLEDVAVYQNQKIDDGTRRQIVESMKQLWIKAKADLKLARTTRERIESLYRDSVVTSQRRDEAEALYQNALAGERAAYEQYRMALDGARKQDRESARSMVDVARGAVGEVTALLQDARLTAPESGEIAAVYPERGELVGAGTPIMSLVVLEDAHAVLNVREDLMPRFRMGGTFRADVPALDRRGVVFRVYYISPLGSYATWRSTKQAGSYDLRTFELKARPEPAVEGLRPGMSVLVNLSEQP